MTREAWLEALLAFHLRGELPAFLATSSEPVDTATFQLLKQRVDALKLSNSVQAHRYALAGIELSRLTSHEEGMALSQWAAGNALVCLARQLDAQTAYAAALRYFESYQRLWEVTCLKINQVAVLEELSEYRQALELASEARVACAQLGERSSLLLAMLEMNEGVAFQQLGELERALQAFGRGREAFLALGNQAQAARMEINQAYVLLEARRPEEAEPLLLGARATLESLGHTQEVARADLQLGILCWRSGRHQPALQHLERAGSIFESIPVPGDVAVVDLYRSLVYRELNLFQEALELAGRSERRFEGDQTRWEQAIALLNLGAIYRQLELWEEAETHLRRARRLLCQRGVWNRVLELEVERIFLALAQGRTVEVLDAVEALRTELDANANPLLTARVELALGRMLLEAETGAAGEQTQKAPGVFPASSPRLDAALAHAERAVGVARHLELSDVLPAALQLSAKILALRGEVEEARRQLWSALELLERARQLLQVDELRIGFIDDKTSIYDDMARLSLWAGQPTELLLLTSLQLAPLPLRTGLETAEGPQEELVRQLEQLRARWHWCQSSLPGEAAGGERPGTGRGAEQPDAMLRELQAVERTLLDCGRRLQLRQIGVSRRLENGREPLEQDTRTVETRAGALVEQTQASLRGDELLIQISCLDGGLSVVGLSTSQTFFRKLSATSAQVERVLHAWRFSLIHSADTLASQSAERPFLPLRRLFDLLIRPLEDWLEGRKRLILVLPPGWHDLPLAALHDGCQSLIEKHSVSVVSSVEALVQSRCRPRQSMARPSAFLLSLSAGGRLQEVDAERREVAEVLQDTHDVLELEEEAATCEAFRAQCGMAELIHLATHAHFRSDNPFFSWIQLADRPFTMAELYELSLPRQPLVVLSACETGRAHVRAGGLLGMGRALLAAGASSLILSLWRLVDGSAREIMSAFYRELARHGDIGEALADAQRTAIRSGRNAFHWAGFLHVMG